MHHSFEIDHSFNILQITIEGEISLEGMLAVFEEAKPILIINQELNILVNLQKVSSMNFQTCHAEKLGETYVKHHNLFRGRKYANVVTSQLGFGIVRQWENFLGNHVHMDYRIFYTVEAAREWLSGTDS